MLHETVGIGQIVLLLQGTGLAGHNLSSSPYGHFLTEGEPDITLYLHQGLPEWDLGRPVFACPPIWNLHKRNGKIVFEIYRNAFFSEDSGRVLVFEHPLTEAILYSSGTAKDIANLLHGPTMELLLINSLAQRKGAMAHACAIEKKGRGYLFVGDSGAGKSTIANIWASTEGICVLSDDRVIIRKMEKAFYIYGTPWHGEAKFASPGHAKLEKIFFLRHGHANAATEVGGIGAVSRLLRSSFPPYWDAEGMKFSLDFLADVAANVPCYELTFRPDGSVIDYIQAFCDETF